MLDPSADEICSWSNSVTQFMADYLGDLRDRGVYRHMVSRAIRKRLDPALPIDGSDFDELLKFFREAIVPFSRQNAHPRMFGYVQSPGTPLGAFADLLASTLNANLTVWRSAPAPVELERLTIDWIRQILGFNAEAGGFLSAVGRWPIWPRSPRRGRRKMIRQVACAFTRRPRRIFPSPRQQRFWESGERMCASSLSTSASKSAWTIS